MLWTRAGSSLRCSARDEALPVRRALVGERHAAARVEFAAGLALCQPGDAALGGLERAGEAGDLVGEVLGETLEVGEAFLEIGAGCCHDGLLARRRAAITCHTSAIRVASVSQAAPKPPPCPLTPLPLDPARPR